MYDLKILESASKGLAHSHITHHCSWF